MFNKVKSLVLAVATFAALAGLQTVSHAQTAAGSASCSGYYVANNHYNQMYVKAASGGNTASGTISIVTQQGHIWGNVTSLEFFSANEVHVFATGYEFNWIPVTIEVDMVKSTNKVLSFQVTPLGSTTTQDATPFTLVGAMTIAPLP